MAMNEDSSLQEFGERAATALRQTERVDAVMSAKLAAARARALDAAGTAPRRAWAWPLSGAIAAALLALVMLPAREPAPSPSDYAGGEALDLLIDEQDPQFYEDLPLYQWLDGEAADA